MVKLSTVAKRLMLGRPLRSDRLAHTLLPKRIALPVFASDALSSVAYAPEEIFRTLSVAGLSAYAFAPWIGLVVALVMLAVVASYRQNVHAYPSGGGDYEVATTNLGGRFGLTVASALLVDYILTVAVSTSSGIANIGSAVPFIAQHTVLFCVLVIARADRDEPARHPRVRHRVRHPDVRVHHRRVRAWSCGAWSGAAAGARHARRERRRST